MQRITQKCDSRTWRIRIWIIICHNIYYASFNGRLLRAASGSPFFMESRHCAYMSQNKINRIIDVMAALRHPGTGCPWDLQQDFASIAPYTLEEGLIAYLSSPLLNSCVVRLMFSIGSYGSCSKNPWAKIAEFKSTAARNTITHNINRMIFYLTYRSILIKKENSFTTQNHKLWILYKLFL